MIAQFQHCCQTLSTTIHHSHPTLALEKWALAPALADAEGYGGHPSRDNRNAQMESPDSISSVLATPASCNFAATTARAVPAHVIDTPDREQDGATRDLGEGGESNSNQQMPASDGARFCGNANVLPSRPMLLELQPDKAAAAEVGQPGYQRSPAGAFVSTSAWDGTQTPRFSNEDAAPLLEIDLRSIANANNRPPTGGAPPAKANAFPEEHPEDASPTRATGDNTHFLAGIPPDERMELEYSPIGSESFEQGATSASADDPLDAIIREDAHQFPPRMPRSRRYSSRRARDKATLNIRSWITARTKGAALGLENPQRGDERLRGARAPLDEVSESSFDVYDVETLWTQLVAQRRQVNATRRSIARTRSRLVALRPQVYESDNEFMAVIRPVVVSGVPREYSPDRVRSRFTELQSLRSALQDLEMDYVETERRLVNEESRLYRLETNFYDLLGDTRDEVVESDPSFSDAPNADLNMPLELKGIGAEKVFDVHPLYERLERAVARQRSWQEEYTELWEAKSYYEDVVMRSFRMQEEKSLIPREALSFLEDFTSTESHIEHKLSESSGEVRRLSDLCKEKGVMPEHPNDHVWTAIHPEAAPLEDIDLGRVDTILSNHESLGHPAFPDLLSQPNHLLEDPEPLTAQMALGKAKALPDHDSEKSEKIRAADKEVHIWTLLSGRDMMTKATFVNQWMLFTLHISPLEVALLFSIFLKRLDVRDLRRWQADVVRYWNRDGVTSIMERNQDYRDQSDYFVATSPISVAMSDHVTVKPSENLDYNLRRVRSSSAALGTSTHEAPF